MKRETYVNIPQPCGENWNAMTPQDKGRYCASCAKTVIDFSQMSDTQVLNYLSQSTGRLCGRFAQDQMERPLIPFKKEKKKIWWMAALMPLTLLLNKANGQLKKDKTIRDEIIISNCWPTKRSLDIQNVVSRDAMLQAGNKVITGTVMDNKGLPVTGASIMLKGTETGTVTDTLGKFRLSFTATSDSSAKLIISALGYTEKEITCVLNDENEIDLGNQYLEPEEVYLGGLVAVVGGISIHRPLKKTDTVKTTIRKIFQTNPFKVYPNPANSGAAVHIEVKNEGHYSIQLLDANSRLIAHSLFDAVKGVTTTAITIPSTAAAGIYFIRLINDDTKQQFTDKLIVQ